MPAEPITAYDLRKMPVRKSCSNCGKAVGDAPPEEKWTIWKGVQVFCPSCARKLGVDDK
jgi:hypothetical protein